MSEVIELNGKKYRKIDTSGEKKMIVCADNRGLMFVGDVDLSGDDEQIVIRNARCVIYWGTKQHVAELVDGPKESTKLGASADVIVMRRNIVFAYECGEGWNE